MILDIFLFILVVLLAGYVGILRATKRSLELKLTSVKIEMNQAQARLLGERILRARIEQQLYRPVVFDKTTDDLIRLAVGGANEHESTSAALKVCKRLHKKMQSTK